MRPMKLSFSIGVIFTAAQQADFTKAALRVDARAWNHALFGHYDPDQMDSAPLQHVLLEAEDIGFVIDPFVLDTDLEKAFHQMSLNYGEEDIVYELDISQNGFNKNETFAILQNGINMCKLKSRRQLAPAQRSDDLRQPSARFAQAVDASPLTAESATTEGTEFLGGSVDIMFVSGTQTKLKNEDFVHGSAEQSNGAEDHNFSLKGRFVIGCDCSHSHLEDTYVGVGKTRFVIRKLHAKCPDAVLYREAPTNFPGDGLTLVETVTSTALSDSVSFAGEL